MADAAYTTSLAPTSVTFLAAGEAETIAFDAGSAANRALLVQVSWHDRTNDITSVTYNGVAMTSLCVKTTNGNCAARLYGLANPASGSNNIVVTMSAGSIDGDGQISAWVGDNVLQSAPFKTVITANGSGSAANIVSSAVLNNGQVSDRAVFFHATYNGTTTITATPTNYTERQDAANFAIATEFGDAAGAASITGSATWSNGAFLVNWVTLAVSVTPITPTVTRYVNTASSAGGDGTTNDTSGATRAYVSLQAAITAEVAARPNLTTNNEILSILCCGSAADTTQATITGFTVDVTRYIHVEANSTDPNGRHAGVWNTSRYRLTPAAEFAAALTLSIPYCRVTGLQLEPTHANGRNGIFHFPDRALASDNTILESCLIRGGQDNAASVTSSVYQRDGKVTARNCVLTDSLHQGYYVDASTNTPPRTHLENCVIVNNGGIGVGVQDSDCTIKNCYSGGNGGADYSGGTYTNSYSEDGTASTPRIPYSIAAPTVAEDDFSTDPYASRWTINANGGAWDATNLELDPTDANGDVKIVYNTSIGFQQRAQVTGRWTTGQRIQGPGVRLTSSGVDGYGCFISGDGSTGISRFASGTRTFLTGSGAGLIADTEWATQFLEATGDNAGNVSLRMWLVIHGSTKPTSCPAWPTTAPTLTYTDADVARFDDSATNIYAGIMGRDSTSCDERLDFWKASSLSTQFTNITAGSEDLHIGALSSLRAMGASQSGSFTTDIDNQTRTAWDVGVDEFFSGAPPKLFGGPTAGHRRNRLVA